jgi:hypothetical protein
MMDFDTIWQTEDEIRTVVDACVECCIWQLDYDAKDSVIRLELEAHLDEEQTDELCAQFSVNGYYDGEGRHGSMFVFQI